jgi:hypothetical protein
MWSCLFECVDVCVCVGGLVKVKTQINAFHLGLQKRKVFCLFCILFVRFHLPHKRPILFKCYALPLGWAVGFEIWPY